MAEQSPNYDLLLARANTLDSEFCPKKVSPILLRPFRRVRGGPQLHRVEPQKAHLLKEIFVISSVSPFPHQTEAVSSKGRDLAVLVKKLHIRKLVSNSSKAAEYSKHIQINIYRGGTCSDPIIPRARKPGSRSGRTEGGRRTPSGGGP